MMDMTELNRMMTNADGDQRTLMRNIIRGITQLESENRVLKAEIKNLKEQVGED